ncbi:guanine-1-methyltransferase-domain-containing protein [Earliella scabrosa]|nr:guanine-1-methyltransferase-domain-containing protein [Earliella scabrosa]
MSDASAASTTAPPQPLSPAEAPAEAPDSTPDGQPLSKKAQKKLAKAAYIAERKKERRAAEKERKKEKKRVLAEKRAAGELDEDEETAGRDRKRQKTEQGPRTPFGARVVVDLGFDEKMTENEVKSLTSQLAYTYNANRKAARPFSSLLFTSLNGRTKTRMDSQNNAAYKRWAGAEWWEVGYERLWEGKEADVAQDEGEVEIEDGSKVEGENGGEPSRRPRKRQPSRAERETVVYLTADSEEELTELKEGETYIIGGIVDHNRYKNLCLDKSKEHHIRSARLPIGTYLAEMRTRKVLTVNQTFEILLKWVETRDWEQALYAVMPKRKFNAEGRRRGGGAASSKGEGSVDQGEGEGDAEVAQSDGGDGNAQVIDVAALEADDPLDANERPADIVTAMET